MTHDICISSYVFGDYTKFIPYYIFSILYSYPDYHAKIFVDGELSSNEKKAIDVIKDTGYKNFEIITDAFANYGFLNDTGIIGGGKKALRWLLPEHYFSDFQYVYIGDVDFLILQEEVSLKDFHVAHMDEIKLPFSNKIRCNENGQSAERLTGLHFYDRKKYYAYMNANINALHNDRTLLFKAINSVQRDEHFLYEIVKNAIDFNDEQLLDAPRPWHGIHLGAARKIEFNMERFLNNSSLSKEDARKKLQELFANDAFRKIVFLNPIRELYTVCDTLKVKPNYLILYPFYFRFKCKLSYMRAKKKLKQIILGRP